MDAFSPLDFDDVKGQLVEVYDAAGGKLALKASASPVLDGGGNVAISPSGKRVAVLDAGAIQVYELPALPPLPQSNARPSREPIRLLWRFSAIAPPCTLGCGGLSWPRRSSITWLRRLRTAAANVLPTKMRFGFSVEDGVYVVCDGMGGAAAGEIASSLAVDEVLRAALGPRPKRSFPLPGRAEQAIMAANEAIFTRAQRNRRLSGMGTTLVALAVEERHVWVLNIGDSRCYRLRDGRLEQLTLDHSLVEEQVRLGRMSRSEALRSPLKNVITRALGTQSRVTPDVFGLEAEPGDMFLLCSDGLTREISDQVIESLLSKGDSLQDLCTRLGRRRQEGRRPRQHHLPAGAR